MTILHEVEAVLTRKNKHLIKLAQGRTNAEKDRLYTKANGVNTVRNILIHNYALNTTEQGILTRTMNNVAKAIENTTVPAYKDGLEIGFETIKAEYLVEFPIGATR